MSVSYTHLDVYKRQVVQESLERQGFQVTMITIPAGEHSKSWQEAERILTVLLEQKFHRDSSVIALGGGVVGDLAGFVASIYPVSYTHRDV